MNKNLKLKTNLGKMLLLHLLPGVLIVLGYILIVRPISNADYPKLFALGLSALFVLVPVELGFLLFQSKKENNKFSLMSVIPYKEKMPLLKFLLFIVVIFFGTVIIFMVFKPIDNFLLKKVFAFLPNWFNLNEDMSGFSKNALTMTFMTSFLVTGLIAPITEELYFRGYLLPRMEGFGKSKTIVHSFLFSLYHFWSPWQIITRTIAIFPLTYFVNKKKNVYIGIGVHCLLNILGDALFILLLI